MRFSYFRLVKKPADFEVNKTFKIFTRFVNNASTPASFSKIQNSQRPTKVCSTRVARIVATNGCDRWKFATIRSSSSKVTRDLTFSKVNLEIAGCSPPLPISLRTQNFSSELSAMTTVLRTCTRESSTSGEFEEP